MIDSDQLKATELAMFTQAQFETRPGPPPEARYT
jgi:hypothetical protein